VIVACTISMVGGHHMIRLKIRYATRGHRGRHVNELSEFIAASVLAGRRARLR
jgi:hypothetical protein